MPAPDAPIHRLSVEDVDAMYAAGILTGEDRVELLDGVLVDVMPTTPEHSSTVAWLNRHFATSVGDLEVRVQDVLLVPGGFVSPDLIVVARAPRTRLPETAELAIEVAVTSHRRDEAKAARFAAAGVAEYWLADLPGRTVTVRRHPESGGYADLATYRDGDAIPTSVGAPPVDVTSLLGPPAG